MHFDRSASSEERPVGVTHLTLAAETATSSCDNWTHSSMSNQMVAALGDEVGEGSS